MPDYRSEPMPWEEPLDLARRFASTPCILLYSGLRMVLFGLVAAALTYAIGRLIGVSIGG